MFQTKRLFDLVLALFAFLILALPLFLIALVVHFTSPGPILFWSDRIGQYNAIFKMPKIRLRITRPTKFQWR